MDGAGRRADPRRVQLSAINLLPRSVPLSLYAGDGAPIRVQVRTQSAAGSPVPLEGELRAQIRERRTDPDPVAQFQVEVDEGAGVALLTLTAEQTMGLVLNGRPRMRFSGAWDLRWWPPDREPVTLIQGPVTCSLDVTREAWEPPEGISVTIQIKGILQSKSQLPASGELGDAWLTPP